MRLAARELICCAYSLSATSEKSSAEEAAKPHFSRVCASVSFVSPPFSPQQSSASGVSAVKIASSAAEEVSFAAEMSM